MRRGSRLKHQHATPTKLPKLPSLVRASLANPTGNFNGTPTGTASRRPLSRPEPPKPPEPAETFERLGPWEIISKDRTGKRAVARCLNCQRIAQIGIGDGTVASCGCDRAHARDPTAFSEMIFAAELIAARRRHKGAT
jgi:hypothetical protein